MAFLDTFWIIQELAPKVYGSFLFRHDVERSSFGSFKFQQEIDTQQTLNKFTFVGEVEQSVNTTQLKRVRT